MTSGAPIAKRLRALREKLGETQEAFAARFDVQQATVARWESGSVPHRKLWPRIARVAGVSTYQLFMEAPVSEAIRPEVLREVLIQAFQLQGADLTRSKLLAGLVIEASLTRQASSSDTPAEDDQIDGKPPALQAGEK